MSAGSPPAPRLVRDLLLYLPVSIVPAVCALAAAAMFTRWFTPSVYGRFSLLMAVTGPLSTVLGQPGGQAASRFLAEYRRSGEEGVYRRVMTVAAVCCAGAGMLLSLAAVVAWHRSGGLALVAVAGSLVVASALTTTLLPMLAASFRPRPYILTVGGSALLSVGISAALVLRWGAHILYLVLGPACAAVLLLPYVVHSVRLPSLASVWRRMALAPERAALTRFVRYGMPLALWFLLMALLNTGDRYVLAWLAGSRAVGIYSVNYNLANQAVGLLNLPMVTAIWPVLARQWATGNRRATAQSLRGVTTFYLRIALGVAAILWAASHPLVRLLLGYSFQAGYVVFLPVLLGTVLWGLARIGQKSLELHERTRWMVGDAAVAATVNLVLTWLWVPAWSYEGAAWATLAGYAVYAALVWWHARQCVPWSVDAGRVLAALAVAALAGGLLVRVAGAGAASVWSLLGIGSGTAVLYLGGLMVWEGGRRPWSQRSWGVLEWKKVLGELFSIREL
jgi:O-antigen/teichoic acid export membrane protein